MSPSRPLSTLRSLTGIALGGLAAASSAAAADYVATSALTNELYRVDPVNGQTTLIGAYSMVSPEEWRIPALARGTDGKLYGLSDSFNESKIYVFNEQTGAATPVVTISTGPVSPGGAATDPTDGSFYFLNTYGFVPWPQLYRVDLGSGQVTFLGNLGPVISNEHIGLAFDSTGQLYSINFHQKALWSIDKNDPLNGSHAIGPLGGQLALNLNNGAALFYDPALASLVAYEAASGQLYKVNATTGAATAIPGAAGISPGMADVSEAPCAGSIGEYGTGCAGSGGVVPHFSGTGCAMVGNSITLTVDDALGGANALLFLGAAQASFPLGMGCTFLVAPVLPPIFALPLGGAPGQPGAGSATLSGTIPTAGAGVTFTMQAIVADAGSPIGGAAANAISISVP